MIGASITAYDGNTASIEDEEIGTLKFYLKKWNVETGEYLIFQELPTGSCLLNNPESVNRENSHFYETNPNSQKDV